MNFVPINMLALTIALIAGCTAAPSNSSNAQEQAAPPSTNAAAAAAPEGVADAAAPEIEVEEIRSEFWLAADPVQGGVILARAPSGVASVSFNGAALPVASDGFFLIGFNRDAASSAALAATLDDGRRVKKALSVTPGNWKISRVNARRTGGAATSAEYKRRRGPELARINAARREHHDSIGWRQDFIWPVKGRISGLFGSQRIYRGTPGGYHSGMDIARPTGTIYVAPADGVVILAANDPFTLEGKLLMIDHGMGLNSAFLHSSELLVKKGDVVRQGQAIGKIGSTGRATGAHLHWGMKWNKARVDPKLLVPALKN